MREKVLRDLSGFTRSSLAADDCHLVLFDRVDYFVFKFEYRQILLDLLYFRQFLLDLLDYLEGLLLFWYHYSQFGDISL